MSDGIFEFMENQEVIELVHELACKVRMRMRTRSRQQA